MSNNPFLHAALKAHALGDIRNAKIAYNDALNNDPNCPVAMGWLGTLEAQQKNFSKAKSLLKNALAIAPNNIDFICNYASLLQEIQQYKEAATVWERAVAISSDHVNLKALAICYIESSEFEEALEVLENHQMLTSKSADLITYRGIALVNLGKLQEALNSFDCAISLNPGYEIAWCNKADLLSDLKQLDQALSCYDRAIHLKPDYIVAWNNKGNALKSLNHHDQALACYSEAIRLNPSYALAWNNKGHVLAERKRFHAAIKCYECAIGIKPDYAAAWNGKANMQRSLNRITDSIYSYDKAVKIRPDFAEAWCDRGSALCELREFESAVESYRCAYELNPNIPLLLGSLIHTKMNICDWADLDYLLMALEAEIRAGKLASAPFPVLGLFDSPFLQHLAAEIFSRNNQGNLHTVHGVSQPRKSSKIRIGYFSMDFREHPVAYLLAELIELHNRNEFEVYGFSIGADTADFMRKRLEMSFDELFDVEGSTAQEIVQLSRRLQIDIAIDLGGYTKGSHPEIFANRAAPIQISYLGYPGTSGDPSMDYFIGDKTTVTNVNKHFFSEKIIFLPNQFQVNPSSRLSYAGEQSRSTFGIPENKFIFCCFNNNWKILPKMFRQWMILLQAASNSVLWLYADSLAVEKNLKIEAQKLGVAQDRLIFAKRNSRDRYLAQYRIADLFLDTFPYNAGTTASDALHSGLPVLTLEGTSFASRMASSMLQTIGLPELVSRSPEEYSSIALDLASNPDKLQEIKTRLAENIVSSPIFNPALFANHIEQAYKISFQRYQNSSPLEDIFIEA